MEKIPKGESSGEGKKKKRVAMQEVWEGKNGKRRKKRGHPGCGNMEKRKKYNMRRQKKSLRKKGYDE